MTEHAGQPPAPISLRVRILASDPMRRLGLQSIVAAAGHRVVSALDESDVAVADGDLTAADEQPVLALDAIDRGQMGLLSRDATPRQIEAALQAVAAGLVVRGTDLPRPTFRALGDETAPLLTPREVEILALIGDGLSNKEMARRLGISGYTVKFHIESLFRKLASSNRAEAVRKGLQHGLIEL